MNEHKDEESLSDLARRVADASVLLLEHDEMCRDYLCIMRDGCDVRVGLMEALNEATNAYTEAKRGN